MAIWKLIETVYNIAVMMAYISAGLWIVSAIVNMRRNSKSRKKGK